MDIDSREKKDSVDMGRDCKFRSLVIVTIGRTSRLQESLRQTEVPLQIENVRTSSLILGIWVGCLWSRKWL